MTEWMIWGISGLSLLILEMLLPGVFMMWLGLAACGTALAIYGFALGFPAQVMVFGVLAAVFLGIGLRLRRPRGPVMHTEQDGLAGRPATALVFHGRDGRVRVGDTDWPARVPPGVETPDPGARLRVEKVDGTVLIVRADI